MGAYSNYENQIAGVNKHWKKWEYIWLAFLSFENEWCKNFSFFFSSSHIGGKWEGPFSTRLKNLNLLDLKSERIFFYEILGKLFRHGLKRFQGIWTQNNISSMLNTMEIPKKN